MIFGYYSTNVIKFDNIRLAKKTSSHAPFVDNENINTIGSNVFDGFPFSKLPNWFADSRLYAGYISVNEPLSDKTGILLNYDSVFNDAICIYRDGDILKVGTMINESLTLENTQLKGAETFNIYSYQSGSETQIVINSGNETVIKKYPINGGVIGVINDNSYNRFFNLSAQYQKL